jgi:RNA recognition motif-containing protein
MRGQAFVIFKDINSAMEAKRTLNGREFYGKTMVSCHPSIRKSTLLKKNLILLPNWMALSTLGKDLKITFKKNSNKNLSFGHSKQKVKFNEKKILVENLTK